MHERSWCPLMPDQKGACQKNPTPYDFVRLWNLKGDRVRLWNLKGDRGFPKPD